MSGCACRSGAAIVAATGLHQTQHYAPSWLADTLPRPEELFVADITDRHARFIKVAGGFHGLDSHAVHTMTAAARAQLADAGFASQLLLGGDTTTVAARGVPGMSYLVTHLRPRLDPGLADQIFVANPTRAFGL